MIVLHLLFSQATLRGELTLKDHVSDPGFSVVGIGEYVVSYVEMRNKWNVSCHRHHIRRRHRRQQRVRRRNHLFPAARNREGQRVSLKGGG